MHPMLNIATRAARSAGDLIARSLDRLDIVAVDQKGKNDFVTDVDREAEQRIIAVIHRAHPDHAILAEESGSTGKDECEWVIDPLDGTANFVHGVPHFCVSIALRIRGRVEHGVIFDPIRQELFSASRGAGARVDNHRLRVSTRPKLEGAMISSGLPSRHLNRKEAYLGTCSRIMGSYAAARNSGSAALDLAYVAAGRLDGFWEPGLSPWDIAAGTLLVKEAGGMVTDLQGGESYFTSGDIVSGGPKIVRQLLRFWKQASDEAPPREEDATDGAASEPKVSTHTDSLDLPRG